MNLPLKLNSSIEIEILEGISTGKFKTRIEGAGNNRVTVGTPFIHGRPIKLYPGQEATLIYLDSLAIYSFDATVLETRDEPIPLITFGNFRNIERIQRRNFVRLDVRVPIKFNFLEDDMERNQIYEGVTVDISGGGLQMRTWAPVNKGDILDMTVYLPDNIEAKAVGKVIRVREDDRGKGTKFIVGINFEVIEQREREKIVKFIFDKQREFRRKGLL